MRKYPIGIQSFEVLREEDFIYVDKTDMIYYLAQQHICFLCRPRRFGKSLTISTLEAYFLGKRQLFNGLKIDQLEHDWKTYPVFHIDFNGVDFSQPMALENTLQSYVSRWEDQYQISADANQSIGLRLASVIRIAHEKSGLRCVVLVDEYDKPILDVLESDKEDLNRNILKGFYSAFKSADADLRFVLLTGVTKFSQVSVFSGFNQPYDISMNPDYDALCGITDTEMDMYFTDSIAELARNSNVTEEQMRNALKTFYDGYHFSGSMLGLYNPFSVLNAFANNSLRSYWFSSGTPSYLLKLLRGKLVDMQTLLDKDYTPEYFIDYRACVEDPLAMLYQSGYLTIKEARFQDDFTKRYRLDYPNVEVKRGFVTLLANSYFSSNEEAGSVCERMVGCLRNASLDELHDIMNVYLADIDYEMRKDKEYHFQYTFYLIFSLLSAYHVKVEQHNSQGRADLVVETKDYVYIFEFKLDGTASEALQQIEDRKYALPYEKSGKRIYLIGASFGKKSGVIDDWQVKV